MIIPSNKRLVCLTGSVWSGSRSAPRHLLVKDGFVRPVWFTTQRPIQDGAYEQLSETEFHLANADHRVLAFIEYGSSFVGMLKESLTAAFNQSERGALVVCPPEIAVQIATAVPKTLVFTLKEKAMSISPHLDQVERQAQLHRIDVDVLQPGAWKEAYQEITEKLGIPLRPNAF